MRVKMSASLGCYREKSVRKVPRAKTRYTEKPLLTWDKAVRIITMLFLPMAYWAPMLWDDCYSGWFFFSPPGKNEAGSERIRANRKKTSKQAAMWSDSPAVLARRRTFVSLSLQHRRTAPFIKHFLSVQTWNKYLLPFIMRLYYYSHRCFSCNYYMGQHYHHLHFIGEETEVSRA